MRKVLLLGASGLIAPHIIPGLEPHYDLKLTDEESQPTQQLYNLANQLRKKSTT